MQAKCLALTVVALMSLGSAALDSCQYERMLMQKTMEKCIFAPCIRTLFPTPPKPELVVVQEEPKDPKSILALADTLTHVVSTFVPAMEPYVLVLDGIKLVARFFHTSETTETTEDYWNELNETVTFMIDEAIDDSILQQTDAAVTRLSEDLQLYMDSSNTTRAFSALDLSFTMDSTLIDILSAYAGMTRPEIGLLHYLDMAVTRMVLWQTTAFRYIADYTVHGQLESGVTVCDIVRKWDLVYQNEIELIKGDQLSALANWNSKFMEQMTIDCRMHCHDPLFGDWDKMITCTVRDGYHAKDAATVETTCYHRSCPNCDFMCFNYCPPSMMIPFLQDNQDKYRSLYSHTMEMLANFFAMQINYLDEYKEDCHI